MEKGIRLDKHFISQVIFRIEFPTIKKLTGNDKEVVKDFANKISGTFPISEVIPHNKINLVFTECFLLNYSKHYHHCNFYFLLHMMNFLIIEVN